MQTLTYGLKKPETNDKSSVWMPAMEDNMSHIDSHSHNGTDSTLLSPGSFSKPTSTITSGQWISDTLGNYHVVVTVPVSISSDANFSDIKYWETVVKINTAGATFGDRIYPSIERESASTFSVRVNDNTLDLIIYYV